MLIPLIAAKAGTCGGKAAALGTLLRDGLPVPDGFVVPFNGRPNPSTDAVLPAALAEELAAALAACGDPAVAVRSSAANEDTGEGSAAGQYDTVLAVRGPAAVGAAIRRCWASAHAAHVSAYWSQLTGQAAAGEPEIAVIIQRLIDADASGVLFTASDGASRIEASWGLGPAVADGTLTPDTWEITSAGTARSILGNKATRVDRATTADGLATRHVPVAKQQRLAIDEQTAVALACLGERAAALLGAPQDIEWAISGGQLWLLQARPITAPPPALSHPVGSARGIILTGTPGAHGQHHGPARVLRSAAELGRIAPGDIVVCRYTDPAWTPLFQRAGGIVTETGGVLSHAAIVAREHRIPAVISVPEATTTIPDGRPVTIDGTAGSVTLAPH